MSSRTRTHVPVTQRTWRVLQRLGAVGLVGAMLSVPASFGQAPSQPAPVDFAKQVVPLLTQAGCNSGACHGAAAGRGYLTLSLFGSRPGSDYETLLHSLPGRFVDLQTPDSSLIVQKPSGYLEHGGGVRLDSDGEAFELLRRWIEEGAAAGSMATVQQLTLTPGLSLELEVGESCQLEATAAWSDGSQHRVTPWLAMEGARPAGTPDAPVTFQRQTSDTQDGLAITPQLPGYWPITVRFGAQVVTLQLWVRSPTTASPPAASPATSQHRGRIDELVEIASARAGVPLSTPCPPPLLARRLWLDLLGRHPSDAQWQAAAAAIERGEQAAVVDRLLSSGEFENRAAEEISDWVADASQSSQAAAPLAAAISQALARDDNLRNLVRGMLLVDESGPSELPALNRFHQFAADPRARAELVAAAWLGVRVGCAQCHDHPLDHWTQDDYFAMAACWAEIEPGTGQGTAVRRIAERTTTDLRTGQPAIARLPKQPQNLADISTTAPDALFVDWLCHADNRQFQRNLANRVWQWLMGSALVKEVDDHRATNPAINPELLEHLSDTLLQHQFALKPLVREIVLSEAYARDAGRQPTELAFRLAACRPPKPIRRNLQLLITDALGASPVQAEQPSEGTMTMMMVADEGCSRNRQCEDPLAESLELVAGESINRTVRSVVEREILQRPDPIDLLQQFYRRLFGSPPSEAQVAAWRSELADSPPNSTQAWLEDILWSWIVSQEFRLLY